MTNTIIIIAVIANAIISQVIATSVKNRQISSSRVFWISFLLSPLVGMFVAMMSPEVKLNEVNEQTDGQLTLPEYGEDKFIAFIDKNAVTIYFSFLIIFFLSGLWK